MGELERFLCSEHPAVQLMKKEAMGILDKYKKAWRDVINEDPKECFTPTKKLGDEPILVGGTIFRSKYDFIYKEIGLRQFVIPVAYKPYPCTLLTDGVGWLPWKAATEHEMAPFFDDKFTDDKGRNYYKFEWGDGEVLCTAIMLSNGREYYA